MRALCFAEPVQKDLCTFAATQHWQGNNRLHGLRVGTGGVACLDFVDFNLLLLPVVAPGTPCEREWLQQAEQAARAFGGSLAAYISVG